MTDTYAVIAEADTLHIEPNFVNPKHSWGFDRIVITGASPKSSTDPRAGIMRWAAVYNWRVTTKIEMYDLFHFWRTHRGLVEGFWVPTWLSDFRAAGGTGTDQGYLDVHSNGFEHVFDNMSDLTNVPYTRASGLENDWAVMFIEGNNRHFRVIDTYVDQGGGVHRITFKTSFGAEYLPNDLDADDFDLVSLVPFSRFDNTGFPIKFKGTSAVADVPLGVTELYFEAPLV